MFTFWQMSPQQSCGAICQIWMWYSTAIQCFDDTKKWRKLQNGRKFALTQPLTHNTRSLHNVLYPNNRTIQIQEPGIFQLQNWNRNETKVAAKFSHIHHTVIPCIHLSPHMDAEEKKFCLSNLKPQKENLFNDKKGLLVCNVCKYNLPIFCFYHYNYRISMNDHD